MKLTWTFYPKGEQQSVNLTVHYVPQLDQVTLKSGGYLDINTNTAYVNWVTYKLFDEALIEARREAFQRLIRLAKGGGIEVNGLRISFNGIQDA